MKCLGAESTNQSFDGSQHSPTIAAQYQRRRADLAGEAFYFMPNVPRQVSLAGAAGGSHETGAKALGLIFCQQALCLSGGTLNWCSSKLLTGQRLTGRVCWVVSFDAVKPRYLAPPSGSVLYAAGTQNQPHRPPSKCLRLSRGIG